jgi:hypothetical protein
MFFRWPRQMLIVYAVVAMYEGGRRTAFNPWMVKGEWLHAICKDAGVASDN